MDCTSNQETGVVPVTTVERRLLEVVRAKLYGGSALREGHVEDCLESLRFHGEEQGKVMDAEDNGEAEVIVLRLGLGRSGPLSNGGVRVF